MSGFPLPTAPARNEQTSSIFLGLIQGAIIKVYVGQDEILFQLPRALLCHYSQYFNIAFNGMFKEATDDSIHLKEDSPSAFGLLVEWMYTQSLNVYNDHVYPSTDLHEALSTTCDILCELFCLSEKLLVDGIQNAIGADLDRAVERGRDILPIEPDTVIAVYQNTHPGSSFRKYVLNKLAFNLEAYEGRHISYYSECLEGPRAIPGFTMELLARMKDVKGRNFW